MTAPTTPRCSYQYPQGLSHAPCPETPWEDDPDGRCFFHSERTDKSATEMALRVREKLARGDNQ